MSNNNNSLLLFSQFHYILKTKLNNDLKNNRKTEKIINALQNIPAMDDVCTVIPVLLSLLLANSLCKVITDYMSPICKAENEK